MQEALLNSFFKRRKRSGRTQFGLSRAGDWAREGARGGFGGGGIGAGLAGASQPPAPLNSRNAFFPPCSQISGIHTAHGTCKN